jgi:hypothetical protein
MSHSASGRAAWKSSQNARQIARFSVFLEVDMMDTIEQRVFIEKAIGAQMVKKLPVFPGI